MESNKIAVWKPHLELETLCAIASRYEATTVSSKIYKILRQIAPKDPQREDLPLLERLRVSGDLVKC